MDMIHLKACLFLKQNVYKKEYSTPRIFLDSVFYKLSDTEGYLVIIL